MSMNKVERSLWGEIKNIREKLERFQKSHQIGRQRKVMLDEPENFLILSGESSAPYTDFDLSGYTSSGSGIISDKTIYVILNVGLADSGGASATPTIRFRKNGTSTLVGQFAMSCGHGHNHVYWDQGTVAVDENYILEYKLEAGGVGTMDVEAYIAGYIERL